MPGTPEQEPDRLELEKRTTADYYAAVPTDPNGLFGQSIKLAFPTLDDFIKYYFDRPLETDCLFSDDNEPEQTATYFNRGDLGIGREMHCIYRACTAELACYVKNLAEIDPIDNKPIFGDKELAEGVVMGNHPPFATVAMVERGLIVEDWLQAPECR